MNRPGRRGRVDVRVPHRHTGRRPQAFSESARSAGDRATDLARACSSFQMATRSKRPSRAWASIRSSWGRAVLAPDTPSSQNTSTTDHPRCAGDLAQLVELEPHVLAVERRHAGVEGCAERANRSRGSLQVRGGPERPGRGPRKRSRWRCQEGVEVSRGRHRPADGRGDRGEPRRRAPGRPASRSGTTARAAPRRKLRADPLALRARASASSARASSRAALQAGRPSPMLPDDRPTLAARARSSWRSSRVMLLLLLAGLELEPQHLGHHDGDRGQAGVRSRARGPPSRPRTPPLWPSPMRPSRCVSSWQATPCR